MLKNKCKITYNTHTRIKHMNCIVAVIIAILALVIHLANAFFQEKSKICSKISVTGYGPSAPARRLWDSGELRLLLKGAVLSLTLLLVQCL